VRILLARAGPDKDAGINIAVIVAIILGEIDYRIESIEDSLKIYTSSYQSMASPTIVILPYEAS